MEENKLFRSYSPVFIVLQGAINNKYWRDHRKGLRVPTIFVFVLVFCILITRFVYCSPKTGKRATCIYSRTGIVKKYWGFVRYCYGFLSDNQTCNIIKMLLKYIGTAGLAPFFNYIYLIIFTDAQFWFYLPIRPMKNTILNIVEFRVFATQSNEMNIRLMKIRIVNSQAIRFSSRTLYMPDRLSRDISLSLFVFSSLDRSHMALVTTII